MPDYVTERYLTGFISVQDLWIKWHMLIFIMYLLLQEITKKDLSSEGKDSAEENRRKPLALESNSINKIKQSSRSILTIRYKCLTKEGIICNQINEISFEESILFYELVSKIFHVLAKAIKNLNFTSVELYSMTGYPLATTPSVYLQPISKWRLQANELIYVYPKNLINSYEIWSDVDIKEFLILIQLKHGELVRELRVNKEKVTIIDIKILLSRDIHISIENITIWHYNLKTNLDEVAKFSKEYVRKSFKECKLFFSISLNYNDCDFSAFCSDYIPCYKSNNLQEIHTFNAYLLYLVREYKANVDKERLLRRLGLLRKISCSPPLVYALYLLFTGSPCSTPHKVAINEGLITSISLINTSSCTPNISKFGELWLHIEEHAPMFDLLTTEIYETTFVSKQMRDNPKNDDTRKLLQAFPSNQDIVITWRNSPSTHDAFNYKPLTKLEDFTEEIENRFKQEHLVELYMSYLENGKSYGLMKPLVQKQSSCVFLGSPQGRYGYCTYFSPEDGICHLYNSWTNTVPYIGQCKLSDEKINTHPLIIFILDMSKDMLRYDGNDVNDTLANHALIFIELFIGELIRMQYKYLLGALVISDSHQISFGFRELHPPTFEYRFIYDELANTVKKQIYQNIGPKRCLINALKHIFKEYSTNKEEKLINICTNSESNEKYDGSRFNRDLPEEFANHFKVNTIIFKNQGHSIKELSNLTGGDHVCMETVRKEFYHQHDKEMYDTKDLIHIHIVDLLKKLIYPIKIRVKGNYKSIKNELADCRITTPLEWLNEKNDDPSEYNKNKDGFTKSSWFHILKQITKCMRSPNPHCRIYSVGDNIMKWLLLLNCSVNSKNIIWITSLKFGPNYPHSPPNICCLTPVYHPNVTPTGQICHPILFEDYNSNVSLREIIDHLVELISSPMITHAVDYEMFEISLWHKEIFSKMRIHSSDISLNPQSFEEIEADLNIKEQASAPQHGFLACPLTKQLYTSPVTTPEGRTYEHSAILQYLKTEAKDPFTQNPLEASQLISNNAIASAVYKHKLENPVKLYWWES